MENDQRQLNNNTFENFKLIYSEVCESHKQQQRDIEHLNDKFNWIIALNIFALGFILKDQGNNFIVVALILFFVSFMFSVMSLWARTYKRGPKLTEMMEHTSWDNEKMIKNTNRSLIKNIDLNCIIVKELKLFLKVAIIFSVLGISMLIINYLNVC